MVACDPAHATGPFGLGARPIWSPGPLGAGCAAAASSKVSQNHLAARRPATGARVLTAWSFRITWSRRACWAASGPHLMHPDLVKEFSPNSIGR